MGLRPLDLTSWFEVDDYWDAHLVAKREVLEEHFDDVVALRDECHDAATELRDEIAARTGATPSDEHPLIAASRLVPDDLCIMQKDGAEWRLTGAVVCFPSRWNLSSKLGAHLSEIHHPVPGYEEELARPTQQFFDRLRVDRPMWRLNWTLLDSPELFQPRAVRRPVSGDPSTWWFRVERQTLVHLPRTDAIVFTIRTYVTSLPDLLEARPEMREPLLVALDTAPRATQEYKGWNGVAAALRPWLNS